MWSIFESLQRSHRREVYPVSKAFAPSFSQRSTYATHNSWTISTVAPESLKICICTRCLCKMLLNFQAAQASTNFQLSCPDPSENASHGEFPRRRSQNGGIQSYSSISPRTVFEQCPICRMAFMHSMTVWLECHLVAEPISAAVRGLPLTAALRAWPQDSLPHYDA